MTLQATWARPERRKSGFFARKWRLVAVHILVGSAFLGIALSWPGLALLALMYLFAGFGAAFAGACLLATFSAGSRAADWVRGLGIAISIVGAVALVSSSHFIIAPVLAAATWVTARGKDKWMMLAGVVLFMMGLILLSVYSPTPIPMIALFGVHALSTGVVVAALTPRGVPMPMVRNHFT